MSPLLERLRLTHPIHFVVGLTVWCIWFIAVYGGHAVACELPCCRTQMGRPRIHAGSMGRPGPTARCRGAALRAFARTVSVRCELCGLRRGCRTMMRAGERERERKPTPFLVSCLRDNLLHYHATIYTTRPTGHMHMLCTRYFSSPSDSPQF